MLVWNINTRLEYRMHLERWFYSWIVTIIKSNQWSVSREWINGVQNSGAQWWEWVFEIDTNSSRKLNKWKKCEWINWNLNLIVEIERLKLWAF
jgi:hypothetical protein